MMALSTYDPSAGEATQWMKPPGFEGNFWGPVAWRARLTGQLSPLPSNPEMAGWHRWGRKVLRDGDIVFRLGDTRVMRGMAPLSRFIARATGSPFSHTGIVAIEDGSPVVYDCSSPGIQRQPFEVWMLESLGALGVKRLKPEYHDRIAGVIEFCRSAFERQVPFDPGFRMDDDSFYCLELTEKAFRSQCLALSEPVRIGDWEYLASFPITALLFPPVSGMVLDRPITREQTVYVPGHERQGVWASPLLETVIAPDPKAFQDARRGEPGRLNLRGDLDLLAFTFCAVRRSYAELPARLLCDLVLRLRVGGPIAGEPGRPKSVGERKTCPPTRLNSNFETPDTGKIHLTVGTPVPIQSPGVRQ
jgi:hypothetical protein